MDLAYSSLDNPEENPTLLGPTEDLDQSIRDAFEGHNLDLDRSVLSRLSLRLSQLPRTGGGGGTDAVAIERSAITEVMDGLEANTYTNHLFKRTSLDQLQGNLGTCYLFAAVDALVERNPDFVGRVGKHLKMHGAQGRIKLLNESEQNFSDEDVRRWTELYHRTGRTPPRAYILLEMAEEVRRRRLGGGGPFPTVEAGHSSELWKRMIPREYVDSNILINFNPTHEKDINSPRNLVCFAFHKAKYPLVARHAYSLVRMNDREVVLLDPAKGLVHVSKEVFLESEPQIDRMTLNALATPLGEYCELLNASASKHLRKKLFQDLVERQGLYKLLLQTEGDKEALKADVDKLLAGPYGDLLREVGLQEEYVKAITDVRPNPRPQPLPPYVPKPIQHEERRESGNWSEVGGCLTIPAAVLVFGGALMAAVNWQKNETANQANPIDAICDYARPGDWQLISGDPVLGSQPNRVNVEVLHGSKKGGDTVLAEAKNISGTCFNGQAPQFVFGADPIASDVVKIEGLEGGESIGTGMYHFSIAPKDRNDLKQYLSTRGTLNRRDNTANWLFVESGGASLSCQLDRSRVLTLCASDLYASGLNIQKR